MKEITLIDYLEGKVTIDILATDLKDSQKKESYDVTAVHIISMKDAGEYEITKDHLMRLLDNAIAGDLLPIDINTITFALISSDYLTWDNKDERLSETIEGIDNPEIGYPLTVDNLKRWKLFLETGKDTFDKRELKQRGKKSKR